MIYLKQFITRGNGAIIQIQGSKKRLFRNMINIAEEIIELVQREWKVSVFLAYSDNQLTIPGNIDQKSIIIHRRSKTLDSRKVYTKAFDMLCEICRKKEIIYISLELGKNPIEKPEDINENIDFVFDINSYSDEDKTFYSCFSPTIGRYGPSMAVVDASCRYINEDNILFNYFFKKEQNKGIDLLKIL